MKNVFKEYNQVSEEIIKGLWDNAIFIFDANVLLNLYRYSDKTSNEFLQTISQLQERVWIPFQVGLEFNRNRLNVISDQKKIFTNFEIKINELIGEVENKNRNPFFSISLFDKLISIKCDIEKEIEAKVSGYDDSLSIDPFLDQINLVFHNKVGDCCSQDELISISKEGERRYKNKIPPGYCDIKKPENERYGDLIIWKQIISKSKDNKVDVIFVLDDRKDDWWFDHQGKTISPRPELLKEFRIETNMNVHFYKPFQFLEYSNEYLGNSIKEEVIEEVKNYRPRTTQSNEFIHLCLTLKGLREDFKLLINDMEETGYEIFSETTSNDDMNEIHILLPNIPDLERRLNSKYISNLGNYNLKLISTQKI